MEWIFTATLLLNTLRTHYFETWQRLFRRKDTRRNFILDMEYKISNRCKGCQFRILDYYCTALSEYMTAGGSRKCVQDDEPPCSKFHKKIKNPYIAVKYR